MPGLLDLKIYKTEAPTWAIAQSRLAKAIGKTKYRCPRSALALFGYIHGMMRPSECACAIASYEEKHGKTGHECLEASAELHELLAPFVLCSRVAYEVEKHAKCHNADAQARVRQALDSIERAQNELDAACRCLCSIIGAQQAYRAIGKLGDSVRAEWGALDQWFAANASKIDLDGTAKAYAMKHGKDASK